MPCMSLPVRNCHSNRSKALFWARYNHESVSLLVPHAESTMIQFLRFAAVGLSGTAVQYPTVQLSVM